MKSADFEELVRLEAPSQPLATLIAVAQSLSDLIAARGDSPNEVGVGAAVHASHFEYEWHTYGIVTAVDARTITVRSPGRERPESVDLEKNHVRILSREEWAHVEPRLLKRQQRIADERLG